MWDTLGIEPTDDAKAIRRAYASQLKTLGSDPDPARFLALREAYDRALGRVAAGMPPTPDPSPRQDRPPEDHEGSPPAVVLSRPRVVVVDLAPVEPAVEPYVPPPPPVDERRDLLVCFQKAMDARDYDQAFVVFDRGFAHVVFDMKTREALVGDLMRTLMADKHVGGAQFLAAYERVGWDEVSHKSNRYPAIRELATRRFDAEAWYARLVAIAGGDVTAADVDDAKNVVRRRRRRIKIRNAKYLSAGRPIHIHLSLWGQNDLRALLIKAEHYAPTLNGRISDAKLAQARALLARDKVLSLPLLVAMMAVCAGIPALLGFPYLFFLFIAVGLFIRDGG